MEKPGLLPFVSDLPRYHIPDAGQLENVRRLIGVSDRFLKKAGIPKDDREPGPGTIIVLESGHQPNFLPHAGTWKKAFLLHRIQTLLREQGATPVAFFGFADQNISTARLLSKNQVPEINRHGVLKIGFRIQNADKQRSFNTVGKPSPELWEREMERIQSHYRAQITRSGSGHENKKKEWDQLLEVIWSGYRRAENFAELNAMIFARICSELLGIRLFFFLYSDMRRENLFLEESKKVLAHTRQFNDRYNREIADQHLDIPPVAPHRLPFWYNCACGTKLDLYPDATGSCETVCPSCQRDHLLAFGDNFENLDPYAPDMDFTAVARDVIMGHGLGVTLFIAGTGGSSVYGRISDRISSELGFHHPLALAWQSRDLYLGMVQEIVLRDLMKTFSLTPDLLHAPALHERFRQRFDEIAEKLRAGEAGNNPKEINYWKGHHNTEKNLIGFAREIFSSTPSFIDILANVDYHTIIQMWEHAIDYSDLHRHGCQYRMCADIRYPVHLEGISEAELPLLYESMKTLDTT